jgi:ligand-binding sensor domain-containing protein/two-component sensor histidine kinase
VITILLACGAFITQAQQINIRKYNIEDGLVNNDILHIYQDSRGFIWLCTRGGLSRYDGSRFTNYTTDNGLTNDMINDIVEIAEQEFIIAQNSDGPRLLKNDRITPLMPGSNLIINKFYWQNNKRLLATTDYNGIVDWHNGTFMPLNPNYKKSIHEITVVNDSLLLLSEQDASVQLTTLSLREWSSVSPLATTTVFTDSHHRTWIGTGKGLKLLGPATSPGKPIQALPLPSLFNLPILRQNHINQVMEDSKGNFWIATNSGLVQVQPNGGSYIFTLEDGLPSLFINCLLEDHQKNIWIGTPLGLAKHTLSNEIKIFTQQNGLPLEGTGFVSPVTENIARFFSGTGVGELNLATGISKYSSKNDAYFKYKISREEILLIKGQQGKIFKQGEAATKIIKWPADTFSHVIRIGPENFIAVSKNKLFIISDGSAQEKLTMNIPDMMYTIIPGDNDFLWVGFFNSGIYKIKLHRNQQDISLKITDSIVYELPDKHIRALYSDKENELWIGTRYKGLIRLLEPASGKYELQHYGTDQGLSSNFVRVINRDKKGQIWAGTMQGMDKLIPFQNKYRVFNYGKVNKFFSFVNDIRFLQDDWLIAAGFPYLMYARDMQQDTLSPPSAYITMVSMGNSDSSFRVNAGPVKLSYNNAQIHFEFSAPQFINEDFTQFSYRLLGGSDTGWKVAGKSHSVHFASLRPGMYTFEVRALGFDGRWGKVAVYGFTVNTPFWQKPWFIALLISGVCLLAYALYRYRIQQLIRLQKVRNSIATDLHDEIGSNLTNISILTNLSKKDLPESSRAGDFLQRISEEVSSSSQALDDIIWSVNSKHDTLDEMASRMRRYAAELFDSANIDYDLQLDRAFEEKKLIMEQRRDVYLLFKEAVSNISKHAEAKKVVIKIAIEHNQLVLIIKDDGKGFETDKETNRHGLKGMNERVKKWKGKIEIASAVGEGVSVQIRLPVAT